MTKLITSLWDDAKITMSDLIGSTQQYPSDVIQTQEAIFVGPIQVLVMESCWKCFCNQWVWFQCFGYLMPWLLDTCKCLVIVQMVPPLVVDLRAWCWFKYLLPPVARDQQLRSSCQGSVSQIELIIWPWWIGVLIQVIMILMWAQILHMPWQLCCHGMCKICAQLDHYLVSNRKTQFHIELINHTIKFLK